MDLNKSELYLNRELSWLDFNLRVLEEAQDKTNPILERVKFLAITASNLDEFFMVRVSGLMDQVVAEVNRKDPAGLNPSEQLLAISKKVHDMVSKQYSCLNRSLLPQLESNNLKLITYGKMNKVQKEFIKEYFKSTLFPIVTPMAIDQSRPFPLLGNKTLNFIVEMESEEPLYAVVQVPSVVPRIIELPTDTELRQFILLENVLKHFISQFFEGNKVRSAYNFRITRNSDLEIDEDESQDLLAEIEKSIKRRKWGDPVRLEVEKGICKESYNFLKEKLELDEEDIYVINGPLDLTIGFSIASIKNCQHLCDKPISSQPVINFIDADIFEAIKKEDILVHHPYDSFECVINFIKTAALDPQVLAIKQTLYRVSGNSPIINALIQAAENGKQVTVLVELKARFDEENNINWAKKLEKAGCHVVYGLVGLKTHCKVCLIVRKEDDGIHRYVHLGTGNYNDKTAKIYTDLGLFTCKETIASDISSLFNVLTGYSKNMYWNKIAVAPKTLRDLFISLIENEIKNASEGKPAKIIAKMNSLVDVGIIQKLYEASIAGVEIKLIVRGICCLKSGIPEISENIRVSSIVDRFLEHSRIYYFENNEEPKIYLSSADWMPRNLDRRVEVAFPIEDNKLKEEITKILEITLNDTVKTRIQQPNGTYTRVDKRGKESIHSQLLFHELAVEKFKSHIKKEETELFTPIYHKDSE